LPIYGGIFSTSWVGKCFIGLRWFILLIPFN